MNKKTVCCHFPDSRLTTPKLLVVIEQQISGQQSCISCELSWEANRNNMLGAAAATGSRLSEQISIYKSFDDVLHKAAVF